MGTQQSCSSALPSAATPASTCAPLQPWHGENFAWWMAMAAMTPSVYGCIRTNPDSPPHLDGDIHGKAWQAAPWSDAFQDIQGHLQPAPRFKTQASITRAALPLLVHLIAICSAAPFQHGCRSGRISAGLCIKITYNQAFYGLVCLYKLCCHACKARRAMIEAPRHRVKVEICLYAQQHERIFDSNSMAYHLVARQITQHLEKTPRQNS